MENYYKNVITKKWENRYTNLYNYYMINFLLIEIYNFKTYLSNTIYYI